MNVPNAHSPSSNCTHDTVAAFGGPALPARRERRERDFGTGYGSSSGYATPRRYVNDWGLTRFRCA